MEGHWAESWQTSEGGSLDSLIQGTQALTDTHRLASSMRKSTLVVGKLDDFGALCDFGCILMKDTRAKRGDIHDP